MTPSGEREMDAATSLGEAGRRRLFARGRDLFEQWLHAPVARTSTDSRLEVRRALPSEFDAIYDVVDDAFGERRPRTCYEWLYRRNPGGLARCWVVVEKGTGRIVGNSTEWPWPIARGSEVLEGVQRGDWAVARQWQRQGVNHVRLQVKRSHAWQDKMLSIGWPNEKLHTFDKKHERDWRYMGPVRRQAVPLKTSRYLAESGWPQLVALPAGAVADALLGGWRRMRIGGKQPVTIEEVRRFDSSFDPVTERCMFSKAFWCPHGAQFLNWRYLEHPTTRYLAFAALRGDQILGYAVVRADEDRTWLMEFVSPQESHVARAMLRHAIRAARQAGGTRLDFFTMPGWPHRRLFDAAGFLDLPSGLFLETDGLYEQEIHRLENWQCLPGDTDFL